MELDSAPLWTATGTLGLAPLFHSCISITIFFFINLVILYYVHEILTMVIYLVSHETLYLWCKIITYHLNCSEFFKIGFDFSWI